MLILLLALTGILIAIIWLGLWYENLITTTYQGHDEYAHEYKRGVKIVNSCVRIAIIIGIFIFLLVCVIAGMHGADRNVIERIESASVKLETYKEQKIPCNDVELIIEVRELNEKIIYASENNYGFFDVLHSDSLAEMELLELPKRTKP